MSVTRKRIIDIERPAGWAIRADAQQPAAPSMVDVMATLSELNKAFDAFKAKRDEELKQIKAGRADVVTTEHVDRINADVTKQAEILDAMQRQLTALSIHGPANDDGGPTPEARAHAKAFQNFIRRGVEDGLNELAVKAALSTDSNADGGFVVPVELDGAIGRVLTTISAMRRLATVRTIGTSMLRQTHNLGGSTSGWVGEQDSRTDTTNPTLVQLEFPVHEVYAQPQATQQFIDDAVVNADAWLAEELAIAFAEKEGDAFVNGDGVKKPRGILQYTKVANSSYSVSSGANWAKTGYVVTGASGAFVTTSATASGADNLIDTQHALRAQFVPGATWLMSRATLATARKIRVETTGGYAWSPPAVPTEAAMGTILGHSVDVDDNMPAIGANSYSIAFANFRAAYQILDRIGTRVLRDPYTNKPYVRFYTTKRVGGGIKDFEAIKLLKFGTS